jgi:thymidylate synthase (FAD)
MILLKPSAKIEVMTPDPLGVIEAAGRTCYKSELAREEDLRQRIQANMDALEDGPGDEEFCDMVGHCPTMADHSGCCGCNTFRECDAAIKEEFVSRILKRGHESVIEHASATVRFVVDRGVSHEMVRHRLAAFSQESTRYVNYGKRGGCQFIIPPWVNLDPGEYDLDTDYEMLNINPPDCDSPDWLANQPDDVSDWLFAVAHAEMFYHALLGGGWTPQQARTVLPNSTKTEVVMTANLREWRHVLKLRTSKVAHPQMREVMIPLLAEFKARIPVVFDDIDAN